MEQRLTLVYKSVKPQYAVDSCLLLEACALYFDNVDMQFVAQLKLKNIGTEKINAVIVELLCFNSFGYEVQKCSYQYDRLSVGKGQIFGVKNAIPLGKEKINKYAVCIKAIAFENGTVKEVDTAIRYSHLPESKELRLEGDLREQYKRDLVKLGFKTTVSYQPQRADGLWQCVCGSWQKDNDLCITCQSEYKALVDALSRGLVENHLSEHNETERKNRIYSEAQNKTSSVWSSEKDLLEAVSMLASIRGWRNANELMLECEQRLQDIKEQKQIEEEHMQQRKRRKKTWSLITFVVIGLLVIIGIAVVPDQKYNAAVSMMHHGEYEKAIATFNEIKTYRDSAEKIKLCKNNQNFLNNFSVMPGMYVWDTQKDDSVKFLSKKNVYSTKDCAKDEVYYPALSIENKSQIPQTVSVSAVYDGKKLTWEETTIWASSKHNFYGDINELGTHTLTWYINEIAAVAMDYTIVDPK